jgi:hypothetical protein
VYEKGLTPGKAGTELNVACCAAYNRFEKAKNKLKINNRLKGKAGRSVSLSEEQKV